MVKESFYQKVLILNTNFSPLEGSGITIRNLLKRFKPVQIGNACVNPYEDRLICSSYYSFNRSSKLLTKNGNTILLDQKEFRFPKMKSALIGIKNLLEGLGVFNKIIFSREFEDWLNINQFDVVYAVSYSARDIPFLLSFIRKTKLPFIVHIYDDWIRHNRYGFFYKLFAPVIERRFKTLLKISSGRICISDKMAREYNQRYGFDFEVFHNPCSVKLLQLDGNKHQNQILNISVFGTVGDNNINEIAMLNRVIEEYYRNKIVINLYGSVRRQSILDVINGLKSVKSHGHISHEYALNIMKMSDILFMPLSFRKQYGQYYKLSMPTKITEYLASSVPILLFAPDSFAVTEYLASHNAAFVVTQYSEDHLKRGIESSLFNSEECAMIVKNAKNLVVENHSTEIVSTKFAKYLSKIASTK